MKIIYENCGVKKYLKEDHRSYRRCVYNFDDLLSWLISSIAKNAAPVSRRSKVRIPYKPGFFSGFLLTTANDASISAMIFSQIP